MQNQKQKKDLFSQFKFKFKMFIRPQAKINKQTSTMTSQSELGFFLRTQPPNKINVINATLMQGSRFKSLLQATDKTYFNNIQEVKRNIHDTQKQ